MGKFDKFKDILAIGTALGKPFIPGAAGTALDAVNQALHGGQDKPSAASSDAIKQLAADNDEQTKAILSMFEYVKKLEARIIELESKF
jgi:hypothetical protein